MLTFAALPLALLGSLLVAPATASPVDPSPVTPSKCVTYSSGILSTAELEDSNGQFNGKPCTLSSLSSVLIKMYLGQHKPFALNYRNDVSFYRATQHDPIQVEFQVRCFLHSILYPCSSVDHLLDLHT